MQPVVNYMTLADSISLIGIVVILLTMVESSISFYMYDNLGKKRLSKQFDIFSAITMVSCYIFINLWIVWIATH